MSSEWKELRLNDFVWFQRGYDLPKTKFEEGTVPVYGSTSILGYHNEAKVKAPGVVTGRSGTLGTMQFVQEDFWPHNTTLWVKDFKGNNERFAYYLLSGLDFSVFNSGGAVPTLNRNVLNAFVVSIPSLQIQQKIADILSAYDDLIENNLKRIELLEEQAQLIYDEWFVRMKFPNHKNTAIDSETGLHKGWKEVKLSETAVFLNGYAFKPKDLGEKGFPVIKIKEMKSGLAEDTPRNSGESLDDKYFVETGDILFSWSATLEVIIWKYQRGLVNQHLFKVTPNPDYSKYYVYLSTKNSLKIFDTLTTGATMKHIKRKELDFIKLNKPPKELMNKFDELLRPIFDSILNLSKQNQHLQEAKDILLPRLMIGMIEV